MSNREKYKRAFQSLHAPNNDWLEAVNMDMNRKHERFSFSRRAAVAVMVAVLLVGSLTAAYATDLGGVRQMITMWFHGQATDATVEVYTGVDGGVDVEFVGDDGGEGSPAPASYVVTWTDENGEEHHMMGGGVAMEPDGTERPLTMDEYLEDLSGSPAEMLEVKDDGRVMLYWYDIAEDITDRFEDGVCRLTLTHGDETLYFTVMDAGDGAYNVSAAADGYVD
jgi:hypothetical protein